MGDDVSSEVAFFSGIVLTLYWTAALFFLRFWKKTTDVLFAVFGIALVLLGFERLLLFIVPHANEFRPYVYLVRLSAFVFILIGIFDKNRK